MFVLIILLQAYFFCYWLYYFFVEIRVAISIKYPRLYKIFCPCIKANDRNLTAEVIEYKEKVIEPLIDMINQAEICKSLLMLSLKYN